MSSRFGVYRYKAPKKTCKTPGCKSKSWSIQANGFCTKCNKKTPPKKPQGPAVFQSDALFQDLKEMVGGDASFAKGVRGVFHFVITHGREHKDWTVDFKRRDV